MWRSFVAPRGAALIHWLGRSAAALAVVVLFGGLLAHAAEKQKTDGSGDGAVTGSTTWGGLNWGLGVAADFDWGGKRVVTADLVTTNNIVRIKDTSSNVDVGIVLEVHYILRDFIWQPTSSCVGLFYCRTEVGIGPFVAIEVGGGSSKALSSADSLITGYALGVLVGLHHNSDTPHVMKAKAAIAAATGSPAPPSDTKSWNFGVGFRVTPKAQVLGDGIVPNQPLPPGETVIRYKTEPRFGIMLLSSFSF
jgi:hypothetical protein